MGFLISRLKKIMLLEQLGIGLPEEVSRVFEREVSNGKE
jgi:hypothetical protein